MLNVNVSEAHLLRFIHVTGNTEGRHKIIGDHGVSPTAPTKIAPSQDGNYYRNSWSIPRHQIVPHSEQLWNQNQYVPSKTPAPEVQQSRHKEQSLESFPKGVPYSLQLKMSRRRRTNQRRKHRRSRNAKPRVVPVDRRERNSPTKRQEEPTMSYIAPDTISVEHIRLGPQNRSRQQTSLVSVGPTSGRRVNRIPIQFTASQTFATSGSGGETSDLNVSLAKKSPIRIDVQPSPRNEYPVASASDPEVPSPYRVGPTSRKKKRRNRRRRRR